MSKSLLKPKCYSLGTVTLEKKKTHRSEWEVCGYAFSFTLWRRPNSFRFSVVCHVPSWRAPEFLSFFLSLSYLLSSLSISTLSALTHAILLLRGDPGPSKLLAFHVEAQDGCLEPWLLFSFVKAGTRHFWTTYCDFRAVVCCSLHYPSTSSWPPWTQGCLPELCAN